MIVQARGGKRENSEDKTETPEQEKLRQESEENLIEEILKFPSRSQAEKFGTMIGAYEPGGDTSVGATVKQGETLDTNSLDPRTVEYLKEKLGKNIGEITDLCKNVVGGCAEVRAADDLIKRGANPADIKFTVAVRPNIVYRDKKITPEAIVERCPNCQRVWPLK